EGSRGPDPLPLNCSGGHKRRKALNCTASSRLDPEVITPRALANSGRQGCGIPFCLGDPKRCSPCQKKLRNSALQIPFYHLEATITAEKPITTSARKESPDANS